MFLLCNYFIFLLIFFISRCKFFTEVCRCFFFFSILERTGCWRCRSSPVLSLCFYYTELEPRNSRLEASGCGFGEVWGEEWCEGRKWTRPLELFLSFTLIGLQDPTEKRGARWREGCCVFFCFLYSFFLQIVSWGGEKGGSGRSFSALDGAWRRFGRKCSSWDQEVFWSPPSGFTVCLQAVALAATASSLLRHFVSEETIHRKSLNCLGVFFYLHLSKKKIEPNFKWMFCVSGIPEERLNEFFFTCSRCSLTANTAHFFCLCLYCHCRKVTVK